MLIWNPYTDNTPFHLWVPTDLPDDEISSILDTCGEVHKTICHIHRNDIDIWEGLELLEPLIGDMDEYLEDVEIRMNADTR